MSSLGNLPWGPGQRHISAAERLRGHTMQAVTAQGELQRGRVSPVRRTGLGSSQAFGLRLSHPEVSQAELSGL